MAEQSLPRAENVIPLVEPAKDGEGEGEKAPSKGALKKAAKEKEKVRTYTSKIANYPRSIVQQGWATD